LIALRDGVLLLFLAGDFCTAFRFWLVVYRFDFSPE